MARYVDLDDLDPGDIRDALTMSTAEIEDVLTFGEGLEDLLVGEVLESSKHPDADKLTLTKVNVGGPETLSIVCGAPNVKKGQKVVVIQPGQTLPDGTRIKKTKIRGQASMGMICSERELRLSDEHEGIIVLAPGAKVGKRYIDQADVVDHVLEIDIDPGAGLRSDTRPGNAWRHEDRPIASFGSDDPRPLGRWQGPPGHPADRRHRAAPD